MDKSCYSSTRSILVTSRSRPSGQIPPATSWLLTKAQKAASFLIQVVSSWDRWLASRPTQGDLRCDGRERRRRCRWFCPKLLSLRCGPSSVQRLEVFGDLQASWECRSRSLWVGWAKHSWCSSLSFCRSQQDLEALRVLTCRFQIYFWGWIRSTSDVHTLRKWLL